MIFYLPVPLYSSLFCFLLIANQGSGKRVTLSLNYFLLYGGIKVFRASFTNRASQADNHVITNLRSSSKSLEFVVEEI